MNGIIDVISLQIWRWMKYYEKIIINPIIINNNNNKANQYRSSIQKFRENNYTEKKIWLKQISQIFDEGEAIRWKQYLNYSQKSPES